VYGSLVIGGMVLSGYDSGFQPILAILWMQLCWLFILVLSFGFPGGYHNLGQRWSQGSFPKA